MTSRQKPSLAILWSALLTVATGAVLLAGAACRQTPKPERAVPNGSAEERTAEADSIGLSDPRVKSADAASSYVGDGACMECHQDISARHARSGHAGTLAIVNLPAYSKLFKSSEKLKDTETGYSYRTGIEAGRCVLVANGPAGAVAAPAQLAVGSGRNGITFIGQLGANSWATLRLSYYSTIRKWAFSPDQKPGEAALNLAVGHELTFTHLINCIDCHATVLRKGPGGVDLSASHLGIGCERCHGPGRTHVESARRNGRGVKPVPMEFGKADRSSPDKIDALCGACHSAQTLPPDGNISSIGELARFQATALHASRCFRDSRALSCVTCHDPHQDVDHDLRRQEQTCLGCHSSATGVANPRRGVASSRVALVCPVNPRSGCVPCHMPPTELPSVPSQPFHNHWIRVWKHPPGNHRLGGAPKR